MVKDMEKVIYIPNWAAGNYHKRTVILRKALKLPIIIDLHYEGPVKVMDRKELPKYGCYHINPIHYDA